MSDIMQRCSLSARKLTLESVRDLAIKHVAVAWEHPSDAEDYHDLDDALDDIVLALLALDADIQERWVKRTKWHEGQERSVKRTKLAVDRLIAAWHEGDLDELNAAAKALAIVLAPRVRSRHF